MTCERYRFDRLTALIPAPPGVVAAWVRLEPVEEVWTEPVMAYAIREQWWSLSEDATIFDPERDEDFETTVVALVLDGDEGLEPALDRDVMGSFEGVCELSALTDEERARLIAFHPQSAAARAA